MNDLPEINAILFDADGVIQTTRTDFRSTLGSLIEDDSRVDSFLAHVFSAEKPCLTGQGVFADELAAVLRKWAVTTSLEDVLSIWTDIWPVDFVINRLAGLRTQAQCCLATNQQPHRAAVMKDKLGYESLFDTLFISCELGAMKPDEDFFRAVVDILGIPVNEVAFIDDHASNIDAARGVGIYAEQFVFTDGETRLNEILSSWGFE